MTSRENWIRKVDEIKPIAEEFIVFRMIRRKLETLDVHKIAL